MIRGFDAAVAARLNTILSERNLPRKQDRRQYLRKRITNKFHTDMGMSDDTIRNILTARTPMTLERAIVIAIALKMPVGYLLADPRYREGRSIKGSHVPEIRYDTNDMVLQQCRLRTVEYENLDIVDIKRKIRTNLKHLLSNNHEIWDRTENIEGSEFLPQDAEKNVSNHQTRTSNKRKTSRLTVTSKHFVIHITTSYFYNPLGFRPCTLRDVVEGNRSLLFRETLVIMQVFDCDLDFNHSAPYTPSLQTRVETQDILRKIDVACDEIRTINQKIEDAQKTGELSNKDLTYIDKIHDIPFLSTIFKLSDNEKERENQLKQLHQLKFFSSYTATGKVFMQMDRLLDTSADPTAVRNQMNELLDWQNDITNDHLYFSPTMWPYDENYPECMNYSRTGKDGRPHRMRCPLCTLANGSSEEVMKLSPEDCRAITKMLRGQFQIIYHELFWDDNKDYVTSIDRANLHGTRQALINNKEQLEKLKECFTDTKKNLGAAVATEFPLLAKLIDTAKHRNRHAIVNDNSLVVRL